MSGWLGNPPAEWSQKDCVVRMIRGTIAKVARLEKDGAISPNASANIRYALAGAITKAESAKWLQPHAEVGVEVVGTVPPAPPDWLPLPTEAAHSASIWTPTWWNRRGR